MQVHYGAPSSGHAASHAWSALSAREKMRAELEDRAGSKGRGPRGGREGKIFTAEHAQFRTGVCCRPEQVCAINLIKSPTEMQWSPSSPTRA